MLLKIGELAKRTGLTVRTLHHYDKIGLLQPSGRSLASYRLYNREDLTRLHRILTLRRLNLSLQEIAALIDGSETSLPQILQQQILALEQQVRQAQDLRERLQKLGQMIEQDDAGQLDYWLLTLEKMSVMDKYFGPDEIDLFNQVTVTDMLQSDSDLKDLLAKVKQCKRAGVPPEAAPMQELAQQWIQIFGRVLPDGLHSKFILMHKQEEALHSLSGLDQELEHYMSLAWVERRYRLYRKYFSEDELRHFKTWALQNDNRWIALFANLREVMLQGHAPEAEASQQLIQCWRDLALEMWNHDTELLQRSRLAHTNDPGLNLGAGLTPELLVFARAAMQCLERKLGAGQA